MIKIDSPKLICKCEFGFQFNFENDNWFSKTDLVLNLYSLFGTIHAEEKVKMVMKSEKKYKIFILKVFMNKCHYVREEKVISD